MCGAGIPLTHIGAPGRGWHAWLAGGQHKAGARAAEGGSGQLLLLKGRCTLSAAPKADGCPTSPHNFTSSWQMGCSHSRTQTTQTSNKYCHEMHLSIGCNMFNIIILQNENKFMIEDRHTSFSY